MKLEILLKTFCILFVQLWVQSIYAWQFHSTLWASCKLKRGSCLEHYNAGCRTDGVYPIKLPSGVITSASCDMTGSIGDGGGWTRLNTNIITAQTYVTAPANSSSPTSITPTSLTFGANDTLVTPNNGQGCSGYTYGGNNVITPTITFETPAIPFTKLRIVVTRTTVLQCPMFKSTSGALNFSNPIGNGTYTTFSSSAYSVNQNGTWVANGSPNVAPYNAPPYTNLSNYSANFPGFCNWNAPWTEGVASSVSITSPEILPNVIKIVGTPSSTTHKYHFYSYCSGNSGAQNDTGNVTVNIYAY